MIELSALNFAYPCSAPPPIKPASTRAPAFLLAQPLRSLAPSPSVNLHLFLFHGEADIIFQLEFLSILQGAAAAAAAAAIA